MLHQIKSISLPNRVNLSYVEQGDAAGINVIFLHGYTDSWHSFESVLTHLPETVHAFAISQRGHGDSERPITGYQPKDFSDDIAAFINTLNLGPAIIVGHCMGSFVAQRFAIDYPALTLGLVLISSFTTMKDNSVVLDFCRDVSQLADPIDAGFVQEFQQSTIHQPIAASFLKTIVSESLKVPANVWRCALSALVENDFAPELNQITVPTLMVWGDQDVLVTQRDQDALQAAINNVELITYREIGHALHWEAPAQFASDLMAFIDRHQLTDQQTSAVSA